jgi:hypothetical protein
MITPKNVILVLDTETADLSGNVYDVGYTITDKTGTIAKTYNALVTEIFTNPAKMVSAFYARKLFTHYAPMLNDELIKLESWSTIVEQMRADMAEYSVTTIAAYNAGFDLRVMSATNKALGDGTSVIQRPVAVLDIWQFACETMLSQRAYKKLAIKRGWVSPAGNIKTGAEFAYRYTSGQPDFIEDHTALSDAIIETQIMAACYAQKSRIPYGVINGSPWRLVQDDGVENDPNIHGNKVA